MAGEGQLLVVLDEFQYAAQADLTLSSLLQRWWSREASHLPIYLVLCGSYIRFFAENVLTGPAYGRNTGALRLLPLGYRQAAQFFPGMVERGQAQGVRRHRRSPPLHPAVRPEGESFQQHHS